MKIPKYIQIAKTNAEPFEKYIQTLNKKERLTVISVMTGVLFDYLNESETEFVNEFLEFKKEGKK